MHRHLQAVVARCRLRRLTLKDYILCPAAHRPEPLSLTADISSSLRRTRADAGDELSELRNANAGRLITSEDSRQYAVARS